MLTFSTHSHLILSLKNYMRRFSLRVVLYLIIDIALLVFCFSHIPSIVKRAAAPFEVTKKNTSVVITGILDTSAASAVHNGDKLLAWDKRDIHIPEAVEFLGDLSSIGDTVEITFEREHTTAHTQISLIPFYPSYRFVVIITFVGIIIWIIALYILLNGGGSLLANVLHWLMICFSVVVMITWGAISSTAWQSYVARALFILSYSIGPALFLFFTMIYARPSARYIKTKLVGSVGVSLVIAAELLYLHLGALSENSLSKYALFQKVFDYFHGFLFVGFSVGIYNIIHSYRIVVSTDDRKRLQWLVWGFSIGFIPFLLLYILPQLFYSEYLIDEEFTTIFFLVIPFSLAISFIKYRFLDIEVVIKRSILYAVLSLFIIITYFLVVLLTTSLIERKTILNDYMVIALLTLAIAAFINPARIKIQNFIDSTLFTAKTNFRNVLMKVNEQLRHALNADELFQLLIQSTKTFLPVTTVTAYRKEKDLLVAQIPNGEIPPQNVSLIGKKEVLCSHYRVLAAKNAINFTRNDVLIVEPSFLFSFNASACVPMITKSDTFLGVLALHLRSAHEQFGEEEIDLVIALCAQAAEILEQLQLQEQIIVEREAKKRSEEISAMKSDFVSYVSHELRTPLTSIKMFSELLRRRIAHSDKKSFSYLNIIEGESDRLQHMVTNILGSAKIDRGVTQYEQKLFDMREAVERARTAMYYQIHQKKFHIKYLVPRHKILVLGDCDAVTQVVANLIENAVKYSTKEKTITITLTRKNDSAVCSISDSGPGIPKESLPHIFEKFYRDPTHENIAHGMGLGLPLVKHIIENHRGTIEVKSKVGKGSTFSISLPMATVQ